MGDASEGGGHHGLERPQIWHVDDEPMVRRAPRIPGNQLVVIAIQGELEGGGGIVVVDLGARIGTLRRDPFTCL